MERGIIPGLKEELEATDARLDALEEAVKAILGRLDALESGLESKKATKHRGEE